MTKLFTTTWATFAKTGNPNNKLIPNWPAYDAKTRSTMIFDSHTRVEDNPRADIRKFIAANAGSARTPG